MGLCGHAGCPWAAVRINPLLMAQLHKPLNPHRTAWYAGSRSGGQGAGGGEAEDAAASRVSSSFLLLWGG